MLFSSTVFLFLFLPIVLGLTLIAPRRWQNLVLLVASLFFYAWGEGQYTALMLVSIAMNYFFAIGVESCERSARKIVIGIAVAVNLGLLIAFKYSNFLVDNLNAVLGSLGTSPIRLAPVHLPLGISFFTFHAISYLVDVYRRQAPAERNPINMGLYITLFPQLVAGPILRYMDVAGQIASRVVTAEWFASGVRRFISGLGKKMLLANTVAVPADAIFAIPADQLTTPLSWLGVVCYGLQIYFDFSGYSDMAIGLGRMFGFSFRENFNYPYIARSITEFWRRWHISLSTWFRDYLYIPLGGNRGSSGRTYFNLLTVFFLCGVWHGASWNFICWGLLHGALLVIERMWLGQRLAAWWRPVGHLYTLLFVMIGWVFFRAETLPRALDYLGAAAGFAKGPGLQYNVARYLDSQVLLALIIGVIASMPVLPLLQSCGTRLREHGSRFGETVDGALSLSGIAGYALILLFSVMVLASGTHNPFIYFRF
jgi:alginate O-acetyltransferase complex protein AlgI